MCVIHSVWDDIFSSLVVICSEPCVCVRDDLCGRFGGKLLFMSVEILSLSAHFRFFICSFLDLPHSFILLQSSRLTIS